MKERRRHQRFSVKWKGRIALANQGVENVSICNASLGGLCFVYLHALPFGSALKLEFHVRYRNENARIRVKAKVSHTDILSGNRGAKIGVEFVSASPDAMHKLANALHALGEDAMR